MSMLFLSSVPIFRLFFLWGMSLTPPKISSIHKRHLIFLGVNFSEKTILDYPQCPSRCLLILPWEKLLIKKGSFNILISFIVIYINCIHCFCQWCFVNVDLLRIPNNNDWKTLNIFKRFYYLFFRERGKGERKRGRETLMCKRNINCLPLAHFQLGTWPATQACALTGNLNGDLLVVCRPGTQPTEPHQPGQFWKS